MDLRKLFKRLNRIFDNALMTVFAFLFLIAAYCVYDSYYVYNHTIDKDIKKFKPTALGYNADESPIGDEMVGWLTIDGTDIDYPIMQSVDNIKYINTDPYGDYSLSGSIFLDYRNSPDFDDDYSIIYGHHMEYGKMFGAIDKFEDESYLQNHKNGTLIVGKKDAESFKTYDLEVFACLKTDAKNEKVFDPMSRKIRKFLGKTKDKKIIALSTCLSAATDERIIVFCYIL